MSYILICILPLVFYASTTTNAMSNYFSSEMAKELKELGNRLAISGQIKQVITDKNMTANVLNDLKERCKNNNSFKRIMILNDQSIVIVDSGEMYDGISFSAAEIRSALNGVTATNLQEDKQSMYAAVPIFSTDDATSGNSGTVIGTVMIISSVDAINFTLSYVRERLLLIVVLLALIVSVLVFFVSQLIIDPIKDILDVVKKMSEGHLHQRINVVGHDEFSEVSEAFNDMSTKLEHVEMSRQEFVSNVSHELKTPLSSIKVLSESLLLENNVPESMYREFLRDITSEVDRMAAIINELLSLVRLDNKDHPLNISTVNITTTLEDVIKRLLPLAEQKNILISYNETEHFETEADEMKLTLAFSNLVENAIKYTQDYGNVTVSVDGDHQNLFITINDDGIGIAEEEQTKVFDRFYRIDKTRDRETGGTGLGLAITHKIVLLHDGSIKLFSKDGEGTSFIVRLPIVEEEL